VVIRIARSEARIFSIEASTAKSLAPPSTSRATCHSYSSHNAGSVARSASVNWMLWNSTIRRLDYRRSLT
jgi:hypothetical protein